MRMTDPGTFGFAEEIHRAVHDERLPLTPPEDPAREGIP